jgi:putative toxin-antitoxin system antitoxin component (TIGR02293 family)
MPPSKPTIRPGRKPQAQSAADPRILEYAEVLAHAVQTFGTRLKAEAWLNRPNRLFDNRSPLQILVLDPAAVEEELTRIDHGMYS